MEKSIKVILCAVLGVLACSCSTIDEQKEEPQTLLSDISGVWLEYAYLCEDGYFVDISDTGFNEYYEFARPNIFTKYTIYNNGDKYIDTQGEWTYNPETRIAHIEEPNGWNLDITFTFIDDESGTYAATMDIKGRTGISSSTIKARKIQ